MSTSASRSPRACLISSSSCELGSSSAAAVDAGGGGGRAVGKLKADAAGASPLTMVALEPFVWPCAVGGLLLLLSSVIVSPRSRVCVALATALIFLNWTVLGTTSSRNSRWSWCDAALAILNARTVQVSSLSSALRKRFATTKVWEETDRRLCTERCGAASVPTLLACALHPLGAE
jgi:hypothetical protein